MNDEERLVNPLDRPEWMRTRGALRPDEAGSGSVVVSVPDEDAARRGATVTSESCLPDDVKEIRRRDGLRAAMLALKDHWAARQASRPRPRMIDPHPPIYDDAYHAFTRMLDADNETAVGPPGSPTVSLSSEIAQGVERPLYGEVGAPFDLASAHVILTRTEHEPPSQASNDTLWIELRLACEEIARLTAAIGRMAQEFVDQTDPDDPVGIALSRTGLCGDPGDAQT